MAFLEQITKLWLKQIERCKKVKERQFGRTARRAWHYLGQDYSSLMLAPPEEEEEEDEFPQQQGNQRYRPVINKSQEFVALYLPYLQHTIPHRLVEPRRPEIPLELADLLPDVVQWQETLRRSEQILSWLMQWWLNWLPGEYGLFRESRRAIPEALVKGRGVLWTETHPGPYGEIPASFYGSVDDLFVDADTRQMRDAGFVVRRRERSAWKIHKERGIPLGKLRAAGSGSSESRGDKRVSSGRAVSQGSDAKDDRGDRCEYYQIWSRMGMGHLLRDAGEEIEGLTTALDSLGPFIYLEVMDGIPHPLNLNPDFPNQTVDELRARLEWPLALHQEIADPWPCNLLDFYSHAQDPWASSALEAALPIQRFLDHCYRYLMKRVRQTSRSLILSSCDLEAAVDDAMEKGLDLEIVKVKGQPGVDVKKMVDVMEFPDVQQSTWTLIPMLERAFERSTGMDPLLHGSQPDKIDRSAAAVEYREAHLTSRPSDFADITEAWQSTIAGKEAIATRLYTRPETVAPMYGEPVPAEDEEVPVWGPLTMQWMNLVMTDSPADAAAELHYTVEAGSGQRKNKQKQANDAQQLTQVVMQPLILYGQQTGNFQPYNELMEILGEAYDLPMHRLMLPPLQPPQPETATGGNTGKKK